MIQKLGGRGVLAAMVLAFLLVVIVGWVGFVSPQRSKANKLDTQIASAQSQLATAQHLLAENKNAKTLAVLRNSQRALPDTPEMSQLLRQLSALTAASHTELDSVTPAAVVASAASGAEAVPLTVTVKGRYFAIQHLLGLLRKSADVQGGNVTGQGRLYTVDMIQFGATGPTNGSGSGGGVVSATITMNAFVYSPASVATTAAAATTTTTGSTSSDSVSASGATP
jgi:Pilus assembly protein, PilO